MSNTKKYISEIVGDDYKKWSNTSVIFNGTTGCGKTYFIFKVLLPYVESQDKKLLYLCNREPLYKQVSSQLGSYKNVTLMTYQKLQSQIRRDVSIPYYDYIVADECHYFQNDAVFNNYTDISYKYLLGQMDNVVIYMSATAKIFFEGLIREKIVPEEYCYEISKDYGYVEKIYFYEKNDLSNIIDFILEFYPDDKILIFINSMERLKEMHDIYGDSADYLCSKSQKVSYCNYECIKGKTFLKRMLFTTKALDNGIDLVDADIGHIITEIFDLDSAIQAIGRKRPIDILDTCRLYFRRYDKRALQRYYTFNQKQLKPVQEYLDDKETFITKMARCGYDERQIARDSKVFYADWKDNQRIKVNVVCYQKLLTDEKNIKRMLETSYEEVLKKYLGEELAQKESELDISMQAKDKFSEYLCQIKGQKLFKEEQGKLKEQFRDILGLRDRTMGINTLNGKLKDCMYPYSITSKQETSRQSRNYKKRYWIIAEIE